MLQSAKAVNLGSRSSLEKESLSSVQLSWSDTLPTVGPPVHQNWGETGLKLGQLGYMVVAERRTLQVQERAAR
jgi:hypothetical protein